MSQCLKIPLIALFSLGLFALPFNSVIAGHKHHHGHHKKHHGHGKVGFGFSFGSGGYHGSHIGIHKGHHGGVWISLHKGYYHHPPGGVVILGYHRGLPIYHCRVRYKGRYYYGKTYNRVCVFRYHGKRLSMRSYRILSR